MLITKAKPNPSGKDRIGNLAPDAQIAGEWLDIQNNSHQSVSLSNIEIQHVAYSLLYPNGIWENVFSIDWIIPAGATLRIHSGGKTPLTQLSVVDRTGADYHAFTGKNYVWNNNRSDTPRIYDVVRRMTVDQATYAANPPEGKILHRVGTSLL